MKLVDKIDIYGLDFLEKQLPQISDKYIEFRDIVLDSLEFSIDDEEHGKLHTLRVLLNALILANQKGLPDKEVNEICVAAIFHDTKRSDNSDNEEHGRQSADYSFDDMADYEWAAEAVESLYKKGFVSGVSDTAFEPGRSISREEFLTMMLRAFGIDLTGGEPCFDDVDANAYYAPYVNAAYSIGIINGISKTEFGVGKPIIRQDAAVILNNLIKYGKNEISAENEYSITDKDDISDYALEAVESLVCKGIISGDEEHRFLPKKTLSRAEAAVLLYRYVRGNE